MSAYVGKVRKERRYGHLVALIGFVLAFVVTFSVSPLIVVYMTYFNGLPIRVMLFVVFPIMLAFWTYRMAVQIREIGWRAYFFPEPLEKLSH